MQNDEGFRGYGTTQRRALRAALAAGNVAAMGCYDALGARIGEKAGFPAVYLSGVSLATSCGVPDVGLLTQFEVVQIAARIARAVKVPLLVDADTGYGGIANVKRTVELFEEAGIAGIQIEDQTFPKRSGEREGRTLVPIEEMQTTIAAAKAAQSDPNFVIIGRTDAIGTTTFEEALERAKAYQEAGADLVFPALPRTLDDLATFGREIDHLMVTSSESGMAPLMSVKEYESVGVNLTVYPMSMIFAAGSAMVKAAREIFETGTNEPFLRESDWSFEVLEQHSGLEDWLEFEEKVRSR
ncbi:methylisocitrate lyase [Microbacterium aoyamense]|uniref:Methylisocitrate lyase n=1 Tax=Microbacterium aoyamense TaxID=344166 RepID=A0ABN2PSH1_9MICO|nr:isocitrate lyase/PEP mutase family protein [Microbacterium aoyamense]